MNTFEAICFAVAWFFLLTFAALSIVEHYVSKIEKKIDKILKLYDPHRTNKGRNPVEITAEEKPMQEGLEEEISRYLREECSDDDEPSISDTARHFAQWGAEHAKK